MNKYLLAATLAVVCCVFVRAEDKTKSVEFGKEDKHTVTMPDSWKTSEPGGMRALEVAVPKSGDDKEDGEIAVFVMKAAGGVQGNLTRWTGAFGGETALKEKKEVKTTAGKTATVIEVEGTYKGMTKEGPMKEGKENFKLLGAIFEDDGVYIKLTGPKTTIDASKAAFLKMVESYK